MIVPLARAGRAASVSLVLALLAAGATAASGCEAIANGDLPNFHCEGSLDAGACPAGQYCFGGSCIACETTDICDGRDNDCDGVVDNGSDQDGDGYKICPLPGDDGAMRPADCDDNNANVHPGATETCNGIDDDCNGAVDDDACPAGQTCAPARRECLAPSQLCDPSTCLAPKTCDQATQQCVDPTANYDLGAPCKVDKECKSGLCAGADALTSALVGAAGATDGVCTKTCCTSAQCDPGFVCYAPGPGGRYCVKGSALGRPTLGSLGPGADCGTDPKRCRSGECVQSICVDTCCSDSDCPTALSCRLVSVSSEVFFACADPPGGGGRNSVCSDDTSCRSAFCDPYDGIYDRCVAPCCTSAGSACGSIFSGSQAIACVDYPAPTARNTKVMGCAGPSDGEGAFGDPCTGTADCASRRCELGKCTDVCCTDTDCPQGFTCRPQPATGQLRCVPRS